ncbi:peptidylprolyl isomerase [Mucilaginibacter aquariorum]|uniref:Periplasmic chaperone PpiD n=1 Tax=Mucilaginibacter aquariorum TaxID=2967225 RepID=A0ABT1T5D8_9SPHI|nr:peptidylprolyl isomerase [Mucilaginibacter aquariorum]MCQ6959845.1 SurA N-terminal domain-containing protein [Mucilaginibacter aquariorum]
MGIMGYLRERMGKILAGVIGLALFAFIASEVVQSGGAFFRGDANNIGEVNGEKIAYVDFNQRLEQSTQQFKQQSGQSITPQITNYIQETTWNQYLTELLLNKEINKLGIVVGTDESQAMISGSNPDPQVQRQFAGQDGQFDKNKLNQFLSYLQSPKVEKAQIDAWGDFVKQLIAAKKQQKYMALVTNGLYVNSLDAQDDYLAKNKLANFKYTVLDYASIPDANIKLTDDDYSTYYNEHKSEFKNQQELRSFEYISFNAAPSKEDTLAVKAQVDKLVAAFKATPNDSLFVQINSETKAQIVYQKKGQLEPKLDSVMFAADKGFMYGPYLSNGSYKIAKLIDSRVGPDSVKARSIILNPATAGGVDKAIAKADSLKKLIEGGKSFADLAKTFSVDKASGDKGGDMGTLGRGTLPPAFEDAIFNGKTGDIKIVNAQFGVALVQIEEQKGSSKVVKVAVVDKPLAPSSKTQATVYSKAQSFLSSLTNENFDAQAKKAGLPIKNAEDVNATAASVLGLDNAREIVKWAFKSEKGTFSDQVFTVGDQYVVARVSAIKPKGILPLDVVKKQIEPMVRIQVKGKQLAAKLQAALNGATSIDQVAQKAGSKVVPLQNIVFANPVIPGSQAEYKVIGTVFGSQPNKLSKPVQGQQGVYVFTLDSFTNPAQLTNNVREKEQIGQALLQRSQGTVLDALKDKANVKDNRAKFL